MTGTSYCKPAWPDEALRHCVGELLTITLDRAPPRQHPMASLRLKPARQQPARSSAKNYTGKDALKQGFRHKQILARGRLLGQAACLEEDVIVGRMVSKLLEQGRLGQTSTYQHFDASPGNREKHWIQENMSTPLPDHLTTPAMATN